jgi:hypothetical protein
MGWPGAPAALKSTHGGRPRQRPQAAPQTQSSDPERWAPQPASAPGGAALEDAGRFVEATAAWIGRLETDSQTPR